MERILAAACAVALAGCFAELNAGYYRASGEIEEPAYQVGLTMGLFLEYARTARVVVAGDGQIGKVKGDRVRPRALGTQLRGDLTLVGNPKARLRLTGAWTVPYSGTLAFDNGPGMARTERDARFSSWFIAPTLEVTHLPTRVTQAYSIGPHVIDIEGDGLQATELRGVQLRISHTFWPTWRSVSPGLLGGFFNAMAHSEVIDSYGQTERDEDTDLRGRTIVRECTYGVTGRSCSTYSR